MAHQIGNIYERNAGQPSLLIASHCSTIRRKFKRIDITELSAILDDFVHELKSNLINSQTYLNYLNEIIKTINSNFPRILLQISSHYFFTLLRNTIRNLIQKFYTFKQLNQQEIYVLRNCTVLINHLVEKVKDVSKILHWITDATFLDALAKCLQFINKYPNIDENKHFIKQITRLLHMFCDIQKRLPIDLHHTLFVPLLRPVIKCLTSLNYFKLFKSLKPNEDSLTEIQKLFLIKCPSFLTSYNGPHIDNALEQVLEIMLPRYVTILNKHIKTIKEWDRPMMHAIHNLIRTIIYARGYFSSFTDSKSFRSLIDHLLYLLDESVITNKIQANSKKIENLLIEATFSAFNVLVYEPNALEYIKQCKPAMVFHQLTRTSDETIILSAYAMLVYTMDENDIKMLQNDFPQLLFTNLNLIQKAMEARHQTNSNKNSDRENIDRNIIQLIQTFKDLIQYEQIRNEILKQGVLVFLIDCYEKLHGLSKQLILECLWTLSFNEQIAQHLREYQQFIFSLKDETAGLLNSDRRNGEATNYGIQKMIDEIFWNVVKEPILREKLTEKMQIETKTNITSGNQKYKYDIMISYCYADKEIVHKIQLLLVNKGYNIWLDRDYNHGHEFVAEVMENSEFVVICMSELYKQNIHCRAEAEYAFNSKRFLFTLNLYNDYKPDGWFSSIINNSIYIDFGRSDFNTASTLLLNEIKQRQREKATLYSKPAVSTSGHIAYDASMIINQQQEPAILMYSASRSSTPGANSYTESDLLDTQQLQTSTYPISRSPTPSFASSARLFDVDTQQQQQPTIMYPVLRSSIPGFISSYSSAVVKKQPQQAPVYSRLRPISPDTDTSATYSVIDNEQDQLPIESVPLSSTSPAVSTDLNKQPQQIPMRPVSESLTNGTAPSVTHPVVRQQSQPIPRYPVTQLLTNGTAPFVVSNAVSRVQRQQPQNHPTSQSRALNSMSSDDSSDISEQLQQQQIQMHPNSRLPTSSIVLDAPPITVIQQQQPTSMHRPPQSLINGIIPSPAYISTDKQPQETLVHPILPSAMSNTTEPTTYVAFDIQQQQIPISSNSKLTTSAGLSTAPSINSMLPTFSETNRQEPPYVPDEYTTRKTHNSTYRTVSINAWRNNDVLDFLSDLNLYPMMPLCESMSGKAFSRLFRMCQAKPSRIYGLLNEELRVRFKGLTLPMGIYTQFLVEMDGLIGPALDTVPLIPPLPPKLVERAMPVSQCLPKQPISIPPDPKFPTHPRISPIQWQDITPIERKPKGISLHNTRIIERAILSTGIGRRTL